MPAEVLERYIRDYIQQQNVPEIGFAWQGGEPTLLGVEFFRNVVEIQRRYADGKTISNALQTNGTLLDDEWCEFLRQENFLVGISIDGPRKLHDIYRVDTKQQPTFDDVMRGLRCLQKHQTQFNTLTVVNRQNSREPLEVYRFLKQIGSTYLQFIPLVERSAGVQLTLRGLKLAGPHVPGAADDAGGVTPWSVEAKQFGEFLCAIFDEWVRRDVGRIYVQLFESAVGQWMGIPSSMCVFAETCGRALALEHNGDLYSCDHFVYPEYFLGNILDAAMSALVDSPRQKKFSRDKADTLPRYCRECDVRFACNGECPKHRFLRTPDGEDGLNYFCKAYKRFFHHIDPYMNVMGLIRQQESGRGSASLGAPARNDPCPCNSGKKFKACCGR
jgi:uncharacterized protein